VPDTHSFTHWHNRIASYRIVYIYIYGYKNTHLLIHSLTILYLLFSYYCCFSCLSLYFHYSYIILYCRSRVSSILVFYFIMMIPMDLVIQLMYSLIWVQLKFHHIVYEFEQMICLLHYYFYYYY